ncbi:hypothetical protein HK405_011194 [Cladochytrium tenue]|nr:hypothetical protein HK405_011194 [Cladochytrium tenue]
MASVRGEVWKYLLGVEAPTKADELSRRQARLEDYCRLAGLPSPSDPLAALRLSRHLGPAAASAGAGAAAASASPPAAQQPPASAASSSASSAAAPSTAAAQQPPPPAARPVPHDSALKRLRAEIARYLRARAPLLLRQSSAAAAAAAVLPPSAPPSANTAAVAAATAPLSSALESVVAAFLANSPYADYQPHLVAVAAPFVVLFPRAEHDAFHCFSAFCMAVDDYYAVVPMTTRLADFLMLFRAVLPDLHGYFEDEELDFRDCASSWFRNLLAKELPFDSILDSLKDSLEDLEQSEIHAVLLCLPPLDMDMIINHAFSLRDEVADRNLSVLVRPSR